MTLALDPERWERIRREAAACGAAAAVAGEAVATYWPSLAVLAALAVFSLALVPLKLEWRST